MKRFSRSLADLFLALALLAAMGLFIYGLQQGAFLTLRRFTTYAVLPASLMATLIVLMSRPRETRYRATSLLASGLIACYVGEASLLLFFRTDSVEHLAQRHGIQADLRSHVDLARQLKASGIRAFPYGTFTQLELEGKTVFPLCGTIARAETVYCNETGPWQSFLSDRYGFRNPDPVWEGQVDLALIGDSFVLGQAADSGKEFAALVRQEIPSTLALGKNGAGPLTMLGMVREYLGVVRPRKVLWVFNEGNDIADLRWEKETPQLRGYLESDYSQQLRERTPALNEAMEGRAWSQPSAESSSRQAAFWSKKDALDFLLLRTTRSLLPLSASQEPFDQELFRTVLARVRQEVAAWGGELIFVYLPDINSFRRNPKISLGRYHGSIVQMVDELQIPLIDLRLGFSQTPDPEGYYWFRVPGTHFTDQGNQAAARIILQGLKKSNSVPKG